MKSFIKFLKESKIDEEIDSMNEEIYSVVNGDSLVKEETEDLSFDDIADMNMNDSLNEADDDPTNGIATGFGGEVYVSLDAPSLMDA